MGRKRVSHESRDIPLKHAIDDGFQTRVNRLRAFWILLIMHLQLRVVVNAFR